ncbi:MAG: SpoIID/LytB domain-containing protein [Actinomycetota bacterium]|nr:SpoIID/LytB domain-containing protein [Actinomycetota bacterium]
MPVRSSLDGSPKLILLLVIAIFILVLPNYALASDYIFKGHGWGHGVGMCQWGAKGMAEAGYSYQQILSHYYQRTQIESRNTEILIKIGVLTDQTSVEIRGVKANAGSGYFNIRDGSPGGNVIATAGPDENWKVQSNGLGQCQIFNPSGNLVGTFPGPIYFAPFGYTPGDGNVGDDTILDVLGAHLYRGYLVVKLINGRLTVINELPLEQYLWGISEMPSSWHLEALKAQACAARTYALANLGKHGSDYDLCASIHCQVYIGYEKESSYKGSNWVSAVGATRGQVITYNGNLIKAYYHSTCGGHTENNENVWGGTPLPYLRGVPCEFCSVSPHHSWQVCMSAADVQGRLGSYVKGDLLDIQITSRGVSGRVISANIIGSQGVTEVGGGSLRSHLGLKSTLIDSISHKIFHLWGNTYYGTAVAISKAGWPSSKVVILARGDHFADALAASPLAYTFRDDPNVNCPIPVLLTDPNYLSPEILQEMRRLGTKIAIILGGPGAISKGVEEELKANGIVPDRIWQHTSYGTAADVARRMKINSENFGLSPPTTAIITTGENFPDALVVSSPAAANNMPILLTKPTLIPPETLQVLQDLGIKNLIIVGGPGAVHPDVERYLRERGYNILTRLWGADQYQTAVKIATEGNGYFHFSSPGSVFITRGDHFTDGLVGGALASRMNPAPILLVEPDKVPEATRSFLVTHKSLIYRVYLLGGPGAVSAIVQDGIDGCLQ